MRKTVTTFVLTALLSLGAASPAWAGDLAGTWVLDLDASDSVDPILKAQGVSWLKRKAAASLVVTLDITRSGDALTIQTQSSANNRSETLQVDGETRTVETKKGPTQVKHEWQGEDLLSTTSGVSMKGGSGQVTTLRSVSDDGATLTQTITVQNPEGGSIVVNRIFRKS